MVRPDNHLQAILLLHEGTDHRPLLAAVQFCYNAAACRVLRQTNSVSFAACCAILNAARTNDIEEQIERHANLWNS